ncbi:uncharacterized protein AB675_2281 [Cyphellophora attinorum]|uniref:Xylanolytic transcriptional activator regulatory domain-containing protein n=1 Tax=Cyphellophora attinorum TaxID=1664694 RepID=A0A0N1P3G7_9EURO|nr:uncharacterized protein AB675_2281 [Phialophora attinorum]KPI45383.1 hypothetical protein AB675_2281 [Phialophora attinorum]
MWIRYTGEYGLDGSLWQNQIYTSNATEYASLSRTLELPSKAEVLAMLHTFHHSDFAKVFPVLDPSLFHETLTKAYDGKNDLARACISAFVAFARACSQGHLDMANLERLKQTAYALIPGTLEATPRLAVIDTLVLVTVLHYCSGALQTADVLLSICVRFLYMVDGHLSPRAHYGDANSMRKAQHYRDLFWICWTFDAEISFRTGRPPAMNGTSCDLTLPAWYLQQPQIDGDQWRYPGDLRLSMIKAEAYQKLYSPGALRKPDAEILKDIRELDEMLETWRQSVSPQNRPPLAYTRDSPSPRPVRAHWSILCLEYHHCMGTIHQASSRCKLWDGDNVVQQGVASSHDLALQARRSVLMYFHDVEERMLPHVFWIIVFFPLSAALAIFCNIVSSPPGDETAISDARLLAESCHELSKRDGEREVLYPAAQVAHVRHLREFVEELVMLAKVMVEEGGKSEEQKRLLEELDTIA